MKKMYGRISVELILLNMISSPKQNKIKILSKSKPYIDKKIKTKECHSSMSPNPSIIVRKAAMDHHNKDFLQPPKQMI